MPPGRKESVLVNSGFALEVLAALKETVDPHTPLLKADAIVRVQVHFLVLLIKEGVNSFPATG